MPPSTHEPPVELVVFDLDGTLIDSDEPLAAAFVALGIERRAITFGHVIAEECARLGLALDDYLDAYDPTVATPFPGVEDMLANVGRWVVCSNKHPRSGRAELDRLGWRPERTFFADAFDGPKHLDPVVASCGVDPSRVLFVGDTDHDRTAGDAVGCRFMWAGWNPRTRPRPGDAVATTPSDVVAACQSQSSST